MASPVWSKQHGLTYLILTPLDVVSTVFISILQMKKLRLRKIKSLAWDHTANKSWEQGSTYMDCLRNLKMRTFRVFFHPSIHPFPHSLPNGFTPSHHKPAADDAPVPDIQAPSPVLFLLEQQFSNLLVPAPHHTPKNYQGPPKTCLCGLYLSIFIILDIKTEKLGVAFSKEHACAFPHPLPRDTFSAPLSRNLQGPPCPL